MEIWVVQKLYGAGSLQGITAREGAGCPPPLIKMCSY